MTSTRTTIVFKKDDIEKFLSLSQFTDITTDTITYSPITEYVLVRIKKGLCEFTLSSLNSFIKYSFFSDQEDCEFLVSILMLRNFYKNKRKEKLTISFNDKEILITDGSFKSNKNKDLSIQLENFFKLPEIKGLDYRKISALIIKQLNVSKKYILPENKDKLRPILNVSSIKDNILLSSDAHISCVFHLQESFDFLFLSKKEIDLIANFEYFDLAKTNNWNIIKYKTIVFGNRYQEDINPGFLHGAIIKYIECLDKKKVIKINAEQFLNFCNSVKAELKDDNVNSYLSVGENCVNFSYEDVANNINISEKIDAIIHGYEIEYSICFTQSSISKVLDSLDANMINISECVEPDTERKNYIGFWLDSDSNFHSICSKGFEIPK